MLAGRPVVYDACTIHSDEIATLPSSGALLLATNDVTTVQAAEIKMGEGVFWGVQYHPELPLAEIADALRRQGEGSAASGFAWEARQIEAQATLIESLGR